MAGFLLEIIMNDKDTELMKVAYPSVFREHFYFECGDGWTELIKDIAQFIVARTNKCHATQVKEKFGTLRFYISCIDEESGTSTVPEEVYKEIANYISEVERRSYYTCETCGIALNDVNRNKENDGWIRNICVSCHVREREEKDRWLMERALKANKK